MSRASGFFMKQRAVARDLLTAGIAVLVVAAPGAALAGDAATGKKLALRWCAACHLVAEDQATASSVSLPSFYDMAKDPDWSETKLSTFLANPHPTMPNMTLSNSEVSDLSSYIESLKP